MALILVIAVSPKYCFKVSFNFFFQFDELKLNMNIKVDLICNKDQVYLLFLGLPTPYLSTQYFQICFAPVSSTKAKEFVTNTSRLTYVKILTP